VSENAFDAQKQKDKNIDSRPIGAKQKFIFKNRRRESF